MQKHLSANTVLKYPQVFKEAKYHANTWRNRMPKSSRHVRIRHLLVAHARDYYPLARATISRLVSFSHTETDIRKEYALKQFHHSRSRIHTSGNIPIPTSVRLPPLVGRVLCYAWRRHESSESVVRGPSWREDVHYVDISAS